MTAPKNAPKKARRTRGEAERERREAALTSRELYAAYTNKDLAFEVRTLALDAKDSAQHELLLIVADRLATSFQSGGIVSGSLSFPPTLGAGGAQVAGIPPAAGMIFNAPTGDGVAS